MRKENLLQIGQKQYYKFKKNEFDILVKKLQEIFAGFVLPEIENTDQFNEYFDTKIYQGGNDIVASLDTTRLKLESVLKEIDDEEIKKIAGLGIDIIKLFEPLYGQADYAPRLARYQELITCLKSLDILLSKKHTEIENIVEGNKASEFSCKSIATIPLNECPKNARQTSSAPSNMPIEVNIMPPDTNNDSMPQAITVTTDPDLPKLQVVQGLAPQSIIEGIPKDILKNEIFRFLTPSALGKVSQTSKFMNGIAQDPAFQGKIDQGKKDFGEKKALKLGEEKKEIEDALNKPPEFLETKIFGLSPLKPFAGLFTPPPTKFDALNILHQLKYVIDHKKITLLKNLLHKVIDINYNYDLHHKTDDNEKYHSLPLLYYASLVGNIEAVVLLLSQGANPNISTTSIDLEYKGKGIQRTLLQDPNVSDQIKVLLQAAADKIAQTSQQDSPSNLNP